MGEKILHKHTHIVRVCRPYSITVKGITLLPSIAGGSYKGCLHWYQFFVHLLLTTIAQVLEGQVGPMGERRRIRGWLLCVHAGNVFHILPVIFVILCTVSDSSFYLGTANGKLGGKNVVFACFCHYHLVLQKIE